MNKIVKAGLVALLFAGVTALPVATAQAHTVCRTVTSHGHAKRVCSTHHHHSHHAHCKTYWSHGVKHRRCYR